MKEYVYSDFSQKGVLTLEIDGTMYAVAQFSAAFAANEIPTAGLLLPLGRDTRTQQKSNAHNIRKHKEMAPAIVRFDPKGEYDLRENWPAGPHVVFRGFFTGQAYRRVNDKIQMIVNLVHWSAALTFSSAVTKNGHVSNPTQLNATAVIASLTDTGSQEGFIVGSLAPASLSQDLVQTDVWGALKTVFAAYASVEGLPPGGADADDCGGTGDVTTNDVALQALERIEGVTSTGIASKDYTWGVPLAMDDLSLPDVVDAVTNAIGNEFIESYSGVTFWDKLVGQFCPMFNMSFVPMIESALVVADTPAFNKAYWREIRTNEYDSIDCAAELHRPLRAVGVLAQYAGDTRAGMDVRPDDIPVIGGCYVEDSVRPGDGIVQYIQSPSWLTLTLKGYTAGESTGVGQNDPVKTATTPNAKADVAFDAAATLDTAKVLYKNYAHAFFVQQMLRGRTGQISGKLRLDIAPLSVVKIASAAEKLLGAEDDLAVPQYACVQRVTFAINAESGMAGTSFLLTHMRTEDENKVPRTSVDSHPLFGDSIHGKGKHGSPLLDAFAKIDAVPNNLFAGDGPVDLTGPVA